MTHSPLVRSSAIGLVALAALLAALLAAPSAALAASPRLAASVAKPYPLQKATQTASAAVYNAYGRPVAGVKVAFSWEIPGRTLTTVATTNGKGVATCYRFVDEPAWRWVTVSMKTAVSGTTVTGKAYYQVLANASATNPVTVKVGTALPLTRGATALGQGMVRGAQLAVMQADASATVKALGIRFAIASQDDWGDPARAVKVADWLTWDPAVLGVAGHLNSGCSIPAAAKYDKAGLPMVTGASTNPALTQLGYRNVFRNTYSDALQGPAAANAAWALGRRRAVVVDDSTPYGEGIASGFRSRFQALGGVVVAAEKTSDRDTDFTGLVAKIGVLAPDIVYYGGIYHSGALLSRQLHTAGVAAPVIGGDGLYDPTYIYLGGTYVAGDFATSAGYPSSALPDGGTFAAAYHAAFPGKPLTDYDAYSYDSAQVIVAAIVKQAQTKGVATLGTSWGKAGTLGHIAATDRAGATGRIRFDLTGERRDPKFSLFKVVSAAWKYQAAY